MSYLLGSIPSGYLLVRIFRVRMCARAAAAILARRTWPANRPRSELRLSFSTRPKVWLRFCVAAGAVQRTASATHHDHGGVLRRARSSVPRLAQVSRRQGRCHQPRSFYIAHPEIHFVHGGPVPGHRRRLPLRLARLHRCGGGFSIAGVGPPRICGLAATCFDRLGLGARHLETSSKHRPSRRRNGIKVRKRVGKRVRNRVRDQSWKSQAR